MKGHKMRSPTQTLPTADFRKMPSYYLVGHVPESIPDETNESVVFIDGQKVLESHLMVAVTPFANLVHMYDYIPNRKIWARNTALEDAYWGIGFDSYKVVFKKVDKETAMQHAAGMKNYNELLLDMTLNDIGTDFLAHADVINLP